MRTSTLVVALGMLFLGAAQAATTGRVIVDQSADPDRRREAVRTELALTQAFAFTRDWVGDETRWMVLVVPASVDLVGLRSSQDPEEWVNDYVRKKTAVGLTFMIDTDGDAVEMYVYDSGKLQLGASGTMGHVHAPRIEGNRLKGHYLKFGDLFDSNLVIDLQFDAELWQAPKATALPADGGAPGKDYLALIKAVHAGDKAGILARRPGGGPEPSDEEFKEMLPMLQAMMPKNPKIKGGKSFGDTAILCIEEGDSKEPASAEMKRDGDRWIMVSSSSGSDKGANSPMPPAFAETTPDLCPTIVKDGVVCGDVAFKDEAFAIRHVLAMHTDEARHLILLSPDKPNAEHAAALWDSEVALEPFFGKGSMRSLLLSFDGAQGPLSANPGYYIDAEGGFTEEFGVRGEAVRIGDTMYGIYTVTETNPETGDSKTVKILRFEAPVLDKRE